MFQTNFSRPETLSLSIPLSVYTTAPAPHVAAVQIRFSNTRALLLIWTLVKLEEEVTSKIVLYRVTRQPVTPTSFSLMIDRDFLWTLHVLTNIISSQSCRVLSSMPSHLKSVAEVVGILHLVESTNICTGNSDERCLEVAKCRGGIFKNRSGKILV